MDLLEKSMFFIPNRLFVDDNEMYVSFNIAGILLDMEVTSMTLHVPFSGGTAEAHLEVHQIDAAWDEQSVQRIRPAYSETCVTMCMPSASKEGSIDLEQLAHPWRFHSLDNHGVYVRIQSVNHVFMSEEHPPYLIVNSI